MTATCDIIDTPDGPFATLVDDEGRVHASGWTDSVDTIVARLRAADRPAEVLRGPVAASAAVRAYYGGDIAAIDTVAVVQSGTAGQRAGWEALRAIRPGEPLTYAQFAAHLGTPTAVRAAASVCARNAVALFVPCHRVLRADGTLGGFAWGLAVKASLLARERGDAHSADIDSAAMDSAAIDSAAMDSAAGRARRHGVARLW